MKKADKKYIFKRDIKDKNWKINKLTRYDDSVNYRVYFKRIMGNWKKWLEEAEGNIKKYQDAARKELNSTIKKVETIKIGTKRREDKINSIIR